MIIISSKKDGFRRCGVAHPAAPTEYPDGSFTPEQLTQLQAEPMLVVAVKETGIPAAIEAIEKIKQTTDIAALEVLAKEEKRKTVLAAIEARRKELEA